MLALQIVLLLVGLALLVKGADWLVEGSAAIAERLRIPSLVIGLTIVAFGTSAPELAVSVVSAIERSTDLAIGNVVGSNITNILLILGVAALICKLPVQRNTLKLDLPVLVFSSVLIIALGVWGRALEWWDGLVLLLVFVSYMTVLFVRAGKGRKAARLLVRVEEEKRAPVKQPKTAAGRRFAELKRRTWFLAVLTLAGLGMIVGGGMLLVSAARKVAVALGMSERVIGLTVVAIGTSLPELVTSVVAAGKGETDIAVGNVIGSNIFNILMIAGVSALICPLSFTLGENLIDACVALAAALLLSLLSLFDGNRIGRVGGVLLCCFFAVYYAYLFAVPAV